MKSEWLEELNKVSHREYWTGFFADTDTATGQIFSSSSYSRTTNFVGTVLEYDRENKTALVKQRGKFSVGETLEVLRPTGENVSFPLTKMFDEEGAEIFTAPHPEQRVRIPVDVPLPPLSILRTAKITEGKIHGL